MPFGYMGKMLEVDLTSRTHKVVDTPTERSLYIGGKGLGTRLLYDTMPAGTDPLSPQNPLVFCTGPYAGTFVPQSVRFSVSTKSPLTGLIANDSCGGDFALGLRRAGYDALVVKGKADKLVWLDITDKGVDIRDAEAWRGLEMTETQKKLPKRSGKAVIGPAGERLVRYACIASGTRMAGRSGVGAVMGSKNLKAIAAWGEQKVEVAKPEEHKALIKWLTELYRDHPITGEILPKLGTANLVMVTSARNLLPVRNFQKGSHPEAWKISGQEMAAKHLHKNEGCTACPIHCGRAVRQLKAVVKGPEYETIGLLGSNLGIFDLEQVVALGLKCDEIGVDTISAGGTLAFAMEANEKGLWKNGLQFGDFDGVMRALDEMGRGTGLGAELGEGSKRLSEKHGGREFAIHVKGLEIAAYDPRGCWGQGLEYATASRGGDHINGATMFWEGMGPLAIDGHSTRNKVELVVFNQDFMAFIGSLVTCNFSGYATMPTVAAKVAPNSAVSRAIATGFGNGLPVLRALFARGAPITMYWYEKLMTTVTGEKWTLGRLMQAGERVFNLERLFNLREGLQASADTLPPRILHEPTFEGQTRGVPLEKMLPAYYKLRGWDAQGVPTGKTLKRLQIRA